MWLIFARQCDQYAKTRHQCARKLVPLLEIPEHQHWVRTQTRVAGRQNNYDVIYVCNRSI